MTNQHSLLTFVHKTLAYRLLAVGLALSLFFGIAALLIERNRVSQEAVDIALDRLSAFSERNSHLLADPDALNSEQIYQALIEFKKKRIKSRLGSFIYVGVFDTKEKVVTTFFDDQYEHLQELMKEEATESKGKGYESNSQKIIRIEGDPYLMISLPFINNRQRDVGVIRGLFAFSPETIKAFRNRGMRAMLSAIFTVLVTSAILYPVILRLTRRITKFSVQLLDANLDTLETLGSAIAQRDSDTNAHNYRVSIYATRIGEELNLPNQTMRTLIKGSFLHDVGKIGIPDNILLKPGKLDDEEFEIMKTHVDHGREIIKRSKWLHDALEVVGYHHEKVKGRGYPEGLVGDAIPITARIFAIADVFDALTSKRPYKNPWSFEEAMEIMEEGSGSHFDPHILETFSRIAKPLYEQFGGKEEVFSEELEEIVTKYFQEGMDSLEY